MNLKALLPKDEFTALIVNRHDLWGRMALLIFGYGFVMSWVYVGYFNNWFGPTRSNGAIALVILCLWTFLAVSLVLLRHQIDRLRLFPNPPPQGILQDMVNNPQGPYGHSRQRPSQVLPSWMGEPIIRSRFGEDKNERPSPFNTGAFGRHLSPTAEMVLHPQMIPAATQLDTLYNHLFATGKLDPQTIHAWNAVRDELTKVTPVMNLPNTQH